MRQDLFSSRARERSWFCRTVAPIDKDVEMFESMAFAAPVVVVVVVGGGRCEYTGSISTVHLHC